MKREKSALDAPLKNLLRNKEKKNPCPDVDSHKVRQLREGRRRKDPRQPDVTNKSGATASYHNRISRKTKETSGQRGINSQNTDDHKDKEKRRIHPKIEARKSDTSEAA